MIHWKFWSIFHSPDGDKALFGASVVASYFEDSFRDRSFTAFFGDGLGFAFSIFLLVVLFSLGGSFVSDLAGFEVTVAILLDIGLIGAKNEGFHTTLAIFTAAVIFARDSIPLSIDSVLGFLGDGIGDFVDLNSFKAFFGTPAAFLFLISSEILHFLL